MIKKDTLEKHGCTTSRLREIFTAGAVDMQASPEAIERSKSNLEIRKKWEETIRNRIEAGILHNVRNNRIFHSVDLALDTHVLTGEVIPLTMYAQGKIDLKQCHAELKKLKCADEFCTFEEKEIGNGRKERVLADVSLPRFWEVSVSLIRSFNTRREAAQNARYSNTYPFYKFDPRGTRLVDKLRAEVVNELVDAMSDDFGYRHEQEQTVKRAFKYGRTVSFLSKGWHQDKIWQLKKAGINEAFAPDATPDEWETVITSEGVDFVEPHPTRVFWDISQPLAKINTGKGPSYIGYWDIVPYRDLKGKGYWNTNAAECSHVLLELSGEYPSFFSYYYDKAVLNFPQSTYMNSSNDRRSQIGIYQETDGDRGVYKTEYFERINPKDMGIADYPYDVWVRLIIAGDTTVIGGEFLLVSCPVAYFGINQDDDRILSPSPSHEIMPWQDQITNLLSENLMKMKQQLAQLILVDKDMFNDAQFEEFKKQMQGTNWYSEPLVVPYSGGKAQALGITGEAVRKNVVEVVMANLTQTIETTFRAILQLLSIVERLLILSPQELGQPAPRQISAREVEEISVSTTAMFDAISASLDRFRATKKRIIYESMIANMEKPFTVFVKETFPKEIVEDAGLVLEEDPEKTDPKHRGITIMGKNVETLRYAVNFNSRDGSVRNSNTQAAIAISQAMSVPGMMERLKPHQIDTLLNEILRLSTSSQIIISEMDEAPSPNLEQRVQQLEQLAAAMMQQVSGEMDQQQAGMGPEAAFADPGGSVLSEEPPGVNTPRRLQTGEIF